ncbi:MAG: TetR/AcrR family transcriptional regulator [Paracoccaceae bacterium]
MGRPRSFDIDEALQAAMRVFWERGFERTSIADLEGATGLKRASIYAAFGDKAALFDRAVEAYAGAMQSGRLKALAEAPDPRAALEAHLRDLAAPADGARPGCFLTNTLVDRAAHVPATEDRVAAALVRVEDAFAAAIARGQAAGSIASPRSPRELARFLVAVAQGVRAVGRSARLAGHGPIAVEVALSVLDDPRA